MSQWHAGERAVHARVGEFAEGVVIGATVPPAAVEFLTHQSVVYATALVDGDVWVTPLSGAPGFATVTGPSQITVSVRPPDGDPLAVALQSGARVGMLAIEPASRRRMRFNGRTTPIGGGFVIDLDQVYANCPRFIQKRSPGRATPSSGTAPEPVSSNGLSDRQRSWLSTADTFVIGTADLEGNADASHRGGSPGFVRATSPGHFRFPDYAGNRMYMTLGNLEVNPHAGFVFVDWDTGDLLQVTGRASVDYDSAAAEAEYPSAARIVDVDVTSVIESAGRMPGRWSDPEFSRFNPPATHSP